MSDCTDPEGYLRREAQGVWFVGDLGIGHNLDGDGCYEVVRLSSGNWVGWYDTLEQLLADFPEARGVVV